MRIDIRKKKGMATSKIQKMKRRKREADQKIQKEGVLG